MEEGDMRARLIEIVRLSTEYCGTVETCVEQERKDFVDTLLSLLPRIYWNFNDLTPDNASIEENYFADSLEETQYEAVKGAISSVMGEDDSYLETFEEDMKYSDVPIGATISEGLSDIYQPLYNFVNIVRDSEGDYLVEAYMECREGFMEYWSQTLCNVLRALNNVRTYLRNRE